MTDTNSECRVVDTESDPLNFYSECDSTTPSGTIPKGQKVHYVRQANPDIQASTSALCRSRIAIWHQDSSVLPKIVYAAKNDRSTGRAFFTCCETNSVRSSCAPYGCPIDTIAEPDDYFWSNMHVNTAAVRHPTICVLKRDVATGDNQVRCKNNWSGATHTDSGWKTVAQSAPNEFTENGRTPSGWHLVARHHTQRTGSHPILGVGWHDLYPMTENNNLWYSYRHLSLYNRDALGFHDGAASAGCITVTSDWSAVNDVLDEGDLRVFSNGFETSDEMNNDRVFHFESDIWASGLVCVVDIDSSAKAAYSEPKNCADIPFGDPGAIHVNALF